MKYFIENLYQVIWSWPILILFVCAGLVLSLYTNFVQFRCFSASLKLVFSPSKASSGNDGVSHFQSVMTIFAGTIGVGCISGVAVVMKMAGAGSIFWMWVVCIVTMPLKFSEALLANEFREIDPQNRAVGGPMYYLKYGLNSPLLALLFAVFMILASFGMGNIMQVSAVVHAFEHLFHVKPLYTALFLMPIVFVIALGGIKRIAKVLSVIVPIMMILYIVALLMVIARNIHSLPSAIFEIFSSALSPFAVISGAGIATMIKAMQMGSAQALFTSEAGLGSSSIAACTSTFNSSFNKGLASMACGFVTTCIVCTLTGLAYLTSGALDNSLNLKGVELAIYSFNTVLPWFGYLVVIAIIPFAFSTMLSWVYYGQKGIEYLFGDKAIKYYGLLYVFVILVPVLINIDLVYLLSNILNALMSLPNLIGLLLLAPLVKKAMLKVNYN